MKPQTEYEKQLTRMLKIFDKVTDQINSINQDLGVIKTIKDQLNSVRDNKDNS